jgi:hypothetical protein
MKMAEPSFKLITSREDGKCAMGNLVKVLIVAGAPVEAFF